MLTLRLKATITEQVEAVIAWQWNSKQVYRKKTFTMALNQVLRLGSHNALQSPENDGQDILEEPLPPTQLRDYRQLTCWCCGSTCCFRKVCHHKSDEDDQHWSREV
jgi:hypothetical protein